MKKEILKKLYKTQQADSTVFYHPSKSEKWKSMWQFLFGKA